MSKIEKFMSVEKIFKKEKHRKSTQVKTGW